MSQRRAKGRPRAKPSALDFETLEPFTVEHIRNAVKKLEEANIPKFDGEYSHEPQHPPSTWNEKPFVHVDDFIDAYDTDPYASYVFLLFRTTASFAIKCGDFIARHQLFCKYKGRSYRVTGASRMGDVWLSADFNRQVGYELRVNVADCSDWCPNKP